MILTNLNIFTSKNNKNLNNNTTKPLTHTQMKLNVVNGFFTSSRQEMGDDE